MSPSERTQSQTLQPGRNQFTQRPGAGRGQMQNLFTGGWRGTQCKIPGTSLSGSQEPHPQLSTNYSRSTGARP